MATLRDVARAAGVSVTTVSYVLNDRKGRFSPETKERVFAALDEVGYIRNTVARSLVRNRTDTIGVLIPNLTDETFSRALRAAQHVLSAHGYDVIVTDTRGEVERERQSLNNMRERRVDGLLFISASRIAPSDHLFEFAQRGAPLVVINRHLPLDSIDQVIIDNISGTRAAVFHLAEQGHRRIGCIHLPLAGASATRANLDRVQGFRDGMAALGFEVREEWVAAGRYGEDLGARSGYEQALRILSGDRPTAIVCTNDYLAIGAFQAARELGLRVPDDVALTGHDNTTLARLYSPSLTSIVHPTSEAGEEAATRLLERLSPNSDAKDDRPWSKTLETRLIVRASSAAKAT